MPKKAKTSLFSKLNKTTEKKHQKMLDENIKTVGTKWKEFEKEVKDLGFVPLPALGATQIGSLRIPGSFSLRIEMKPMTIEQYDRHMNPEKYEQAEKERLAEQKANAIEQASAEITKLREDGKNEEADKIQARIDTLLAEDKKETTTNEKA